jgi:GNAT superfamily N-acetyltransferase
VSIGKVVVRPATLADSERALAVVRQSIVQLCVDDHHDDTATLERWLANKTPEHFARWLAQPDGLVVVAELGGCIRGVGNVVRAGKIHLVYVEPGFERVGLGAAILTALEAQARAWGLRELTLGSSCNARGFYARHGYQPDGGAEEAFGVLRCFPLKKALPPNS